MRRICILLLVSALALPAVALASRSTPGDGSLVVSKANGTVMVKGKGLIYGHVEQGRLTVVSYRPDGITVPAVSGAKWWLQPGNLDVVYVGNDVRFLFPSGQYVLRFEGSGIDLSAVGKGVIQVIGAGTLDDGSYAVNGGKPNDVGFGSAVFGGNNGNGNGNGGGNAGGNPGAGNGKPNRDKQS